MSGRGFGQPSSLADRLPAAGQCCRRCSQSRQHIFFPRSAVRTQECAAAEEFMRGVRLAYPEVAAAVRTAQLAHKLLARKAAFLSDLNKTGATGRQGFIAHMQR